MNTEQVRLNEQGAAISALEAAAGPACRPLINRLSNCVGAAEVTGENRVLRIVGMQLAQRGLGELFEDLYSSVIDNAKPGDGQRFLQSQFQS